ncbi:hypothetical protein D9758_009071 [Tetrapyrgos nigripes]|uniref:Nephrocystin 3-like N-terminal domain-containing protein n=1 Tax=Tetrapyrgos nigripes TaxID=182062 RepID=A0A8H5GAE8_9AGAR|nr:hypothetical protein D9758_009071 [Tetrapyrgos nigripes]
MIVAASDMTENTEQVTNNTEQRGFIGDPPSAFGLATQPGPGINILQGASGFTVQHSTINAVGRDQVTNVQNINNYYQGTTDSDIGLLRERLNPILKPARKTDYCLVNTRVQILKDLCAWAVNPDIKLIWISGTAGTGKSAIAVTLAEKYREMQPQVTLAVTYHCVRGQETSNIARIVPTICYFLALTSPAYKAALVQKFWKDPSLNADLSPPMQIRAFLSFFQSDLNQGQAQIKPVIIVDGLDEMGNSDERYALLKEFESLFKEVPWFKLVITSRPQIKSEISDIWRASNQFQSVDLNNQYNADADIQAFFIYHLDRINAKWGAADHIEELVAKADGLFIWATTALKYLEEGVDKNYNLKTLLRSHNNNSKHGQYASLYALYTAVLEEHFTTDENALGYLKAIITYNGQIVQELCKEDLSPTEYVTVMEFSPDGHHLVAGREDGLGEIWNVLTGMQTEMQSLTSVSCIKYSPDGTMIATGSQTAVILWNADTGSQAHLPFTGHTDSVTHLAFSSDGKYIASSSLDQTIRIWDILTGIAIGLPLRGNYSSIAYSPDGTYLISANNFNIEMWNLNSKKKEIMITNDTVFSVAYTPDGKFILSASETNIFKWDAQTRQKIAKVDIPIVTDQWYSWYNKIAFSSNQRYVAIANGTSITKLEVSMDNSASVHPAKHVQASKLIGIVSVTYSADGKYIATASSDDRVRTWDVSTGQQIGKLILWIHPSLQRAFQDKRQVLTIPPDAENHSIELDWGNFAYGTSWTDAWSDHD